MRKKAPDDWERIQDPPVSGCEYNPDENCIGDYYQEYQR